MENKKIDDSLFREMLDALENYALPALNYLSIRAPNADDLPEFNRRFIIVRNLIAKAKGV